MKRYWNFQGLLVVLLILLTCVLVNGFVVQAQPYDLEITSTPLKVANPGELVTHVFTLHNKGSSPDTYDLNLTLPENWSSLPVSDQATVGPGGSKPVFVNINVPQNAEAKRYAIKLTGVSTGDPTLEASKTTYIQVNSVPSFELTWEAKPQRIGPGSTVRGTIKVTNTGNLPDRYNIEAVTPEGWSYSVEEKTIQLMPGQTSVLTVKFTAPANAQSGERYRLNVKAISEHERGLESEITVTGVTAPPPPERVSRTLFPSWEVFTNSYINQEGDPQFYIRGRGDIPDLGEVSGNLGLSTEGVENASLRVMRERWGFSLDGSSISGSYLGVTGSPLIIGELDDIATRFIFTEERKGASIEKEGDYWDMRAVLGRDDSNRSVAFSELQGSYEFSNGIVLDGLITSAETQTSSGTVVEAGLEMQGEKINIYPTFYRVYPGYPGQTPRLGGGVNFSYEEDEFTSTVDWRYNRTRLGEDSNYYHNTENNVNLSTTLFLGENLDSNFSLGFTWRKSDDEPVSNDLYSNSFSGSLSGGDFLTWSLGTSYNRTHDRVSDTIVSSHSVNGNLAFQIEDSEHSVSTSIARVESPTSTSYSNTFTFSSEFPSYPLSPSFSLSKGSDDAIFYGNFSADSADELSLNISFSASLVQQDSVSLSLSMSFPDPFRYCGPTKGQIRGYLFVDVNGNGRKDPEERWVKGSTLKLNQQEAVSGNRGEFVFPPVQPRQYRLSVDAIPSGLKPGIVLPVSVRIKAGETKEIPVPLTPRSWIKGQVFNDKNQDGRRQANESGMGGVSVKISGNGISKQLSTSTTGNFVVDVKPGRYKLTLQSDSLPERYEPTTPASVEVITEKTTSAGVKFGVYQKPKPVIVTFGPPTAKFKYSPSIPLVGEEVTFNASESSAIETQIETYDWKFSHEGKVIEREGESISLAFFRAGVWEVSLTVTDKNGLRGREVRTIQIRDR